MKKFKLPEGAKTFSTPLKATVGSWVEMDFDAYFHKYGVRWLRVKDGMGGRGDRDDWVADTPRVGICVHDYHWTGPLFGHRYPSFDAALRGEFRRALDGAKTRLSEAESKAKELRESITLIETAVKEFS